MAGTTAGRIRATNRVLTEIIFDRRVFWTVFSHNLGYFFVGRYSGLLPYFFPACSPWASCSGVAPAKAWQWLVLGAAVAEILLLLIWVPYTYNGGGGSIGNRYFMNTYGVFLFLLPPIESPGGRDGAVGRRRPVLRADRAQPVLFRRSTRPSRRSRARCGWLPVELTLVNDLPINTQPNRARVWFGGHGGSRSTSSTTTRTRARVTSSGCAVSRERSSSSRRSSRHPSSSSPWRRRVRRHGSRCRAAGGAQRST